RSIRRALRDRCPFRSRQLAFESVEKAIENQPLSLIEPDVSMLLPKSRLLKHCAERSLSPVDSLTKAAEKPFAPQRDVERALLRPLADLVVLVPLVSNLR